MCEGEGVYIEKMANYPVGKLIAEMRRRRGISQMELAGEICSVSTISKIENGVQAPSRKVCEGLMQRLGIPITGSRLYISSEELQKSMIEEQIIHCMDAGRYEKAGELLQIYEQMRGNHEDGVLEQQFALRVRGNLLLALGTNLPLAEEVLVKALRLTIPEMDLEHPERLTLLTNEELAILQKFSEVSYALGNQARGKRLHFFLKGYLETAKTDELAHIRIYPGVVSTLARWLEADGRFAEALQFCEYGISVCMEYGRLTEFPKLMETKTYALIALGRKEEAAVSLQQVCTILQSLGEPMKAQLVEKNAKALFQGNDAAADSHFR